MNTLPMADAVPKDVDVDKIKAVVKKRNLGSLANNTKWNELIEAVRGHEDWRPSYRSKFVGGHISYWDNEWFYHLPFPFVDVEWLDLEIRSDITNIEWLICLVKKIGFEFEVRDHVLRIWGYGPKSYEEF